MATRRSSRLSAKASADVGGASPVSPASTLTPLAAASTPLSSPPAADHPAVGPAVLAQETSALRDAMELLLCTVSIYACYLGYGILHEKLTKQSYGGERFTHSLFLTTLQCFGNAVWALLLVVVEAFRRPTHHAHGSHSPIPLHRHLYHLVFDHVPKYKYAVIAGTYFAAMASSTAALQHVSYPVQALAKSSKLIPVMLGRLLVGARYAPREYLHVLAITGGIAAFFYFEVAATDKAAKAVSDAASPLLGALLLAFSLSMDAVTSPLQEQISHTYKPTVMTMTFWMNLFPCAVMACVTAYTGQLQSAIAFIQRHPEMSLDLAVYCFLSAIGQSVIVWALFRFNSMTVTVVTTTRKFFTILASVVWFGNSIAAGQWAGVAVVFAGIAADVQFKFQQKKSKKQKHA